MTLLIFKAGTETIATSAWTAKTEGNCVFVYYREADDTRVSFPLTMDQFMSKKWDDTIDLRGMDGPYK